MPAKPKSKIANKEFARTKIVATIGPGSESKDTLVNMIEAGLDVARLNLSHGTHEWHKMIFDHIRSISDETTILFDLQGPKIRLGELDKSYVLNQNDYFTLTTEEIVGNNKRASVSLDSLNNSVKKNDLIYINDGIIGLRVKSVDGDDIHCKVLSSGEISSKKGVNVPNVNLNVSSLTEKDLDDLEFIFELEPDYIALSFVRTHEDVIGLRKIIKGDGQAIPIVSKIEHAFAIKNFDRILAETDAIMVARGDLGIETTITKLPILQKELIRKCNVQGKPVITATQMLESMKNNPRPTRAEASDVANAIYDGTDSVMLSAETAIGKYPIESITMMNKIALNVEQELHWKDYPIKKVNEQELIAENLAAAAGMLVDNMPIKAILAFTEGGFSARLIAKHRPRTRIYVATPRIKIIRQLGIIWGCYPLLVKEYQNTDQMVVETVDVAKKTGHIKDKDMIVVISGSVLCPGRTNLLRAYKVSDIPSPKEFNAVI
ncbi:MAG: pyruvate kinase [Asgard group archaeon]|nr:pyruvate kinase [Asgard group archaeon]